MVVVGKKCSLTQERKDYKLHIAGCCSRLR